MFCLCVVDESSCAVVCTSEFGIRSLSNAVVLYNYPYHHLHNKLVERFNGILKLMFKQLCLHNDTDCTLMLYYLLISKFFKKVQVSPFVFMSQVAFLNHFPGSKWTAIVFDSRVLFL